MNTNCAGRMRRRRLALLTLALLFPALCLMAQENSAPASPDGLLRFDIAVPEPVLRGVPVARVVITVRNTDGTVDATFNERPTIRGLRVIEHGKVVEPGPFREGRLELVSDPAAGRRVYVDRDVIAVESAAGRESRRAVDRLSAWWSLVPPVAAILLAIWLREVIVSLFVAVWMGATILADGNPIRGFLQTLDEYLVNELVQPGDPAHDHMLIILFTVFLGAMVGVLSASGGSAELVRRMAVFTTNRRRGQLLTWAMGLVIFFDDYANTLLVGGTMRPVTDRLRISREKLAFLVDSTAAPVAGLALVSTWVGFEIGQITDSFANLQVDVNGFSVFLETLVYRFYPVYLLVFVWIVAWTGRDFGPMARAERRAAAENTDEHAIALSDALIKGGPARRPLIRNAIIPLAVLLIALLAGLWLTGTEGLNAANLQLRQSGRPEIPVSLTNLLIHSSGNRVLVVSSFLAAAAAVLCAVGTRSLTLLEALEAWIEGAKSMFLPLVILVLAWSIATVCDDRHLNTAGFLVELTHGKMPAAWMPTVVFLLAAGVSFATGSSFSTMGLLMPLCVSVTYHLLEPGGGSVADNPLMLGTVGAVLAGAIFGDHCSPISDTTVLSSAASGCDHLAHVTTQAPYAFTVAAVSLLAGYIPLAFGFDLPLVLLPAGAVVLYAIVRRAGRPIDDARKPTS